MYKGIAVSPGVVVGVAHRLESVFAAHEPKWLGDPSLVPAEIERFDRAVVLATAELETIIAKVSEELGSKNSGIFEGHLSIVNDPSLRTKVHEMIESQELTALSALQQVMNDYAAIFARAQQEYFHERMADVRDAFTKIGAHLTADGPAAVGPDPTSDGEPIILVAHEILPSQAMSLDDLHIGGIVTETGGATSHAAILSRSRGIPAVSGVEGIFDDVKTGDSIVVDGRDGVVEVRPSAEMVKAYRKMEREFFDLKDRLVLNRDQPAVTADGAQVELLANINNLADARDAARVGATGVGLFRTEYLFLTHADVPDEEEQYKHYKEVIEASPNQVVTIRTLDLGGDKTVAYLGRRNEANPFMGWRSIRLSLEHSRLFDRQIRAILRAGKHGKVSMLFPMITTLEELREVNQLVDAARRNLRQEGIPFGEDVKTGVMIEVPAAAVCIEALLRKTEFISIGSNDLIQYLVAADRDNPKVAHLCEPLSPAIFKVLQNVLEACRRTGTPVTICGEMAGQPRSVLTLYGMGMRRFSMSPAFVPTIKALIASVTSAQAERFAHQVLQLKTNEEIRTYLTDRMHEVSRALEVFDST